MSEETEQGGGGSLVAELLAFSEWAASRRNEYSPRSGEYTYMDGTRSGYDAAAGLAEPYEARWQAERQRHAALVEGLRALECRYRTIAANCILPQYGISGAYLNVADEIVALLLDTATTAADGGGAKEAKPLTYGQRAKFACKVCGNVPDERGTVEHGRGCYVVSEDGGGSSYVDMMEG